MILSWNVEKNVRCLIAHSTIDSPLVDLSTIDLDCDWFYDFKLKYGEKLVDLNLGWFYYLKLKCWGKSKSSTLEGNYLGDKH